MSALTTGLLPRTDKARESFLHRDYGGAKDVRRTVRQPIGWIRNQRSKPSCVGQAFAAGVDANTGHPPWASGVELWRDARRRQGRLEGVLQGTRSEYVIDSLLHRGWSPYHAGEDTRSSDDDDNPKGSLSDEMFAYDKRQVGVVHFSVNRDKVVTVIDALSRGHIVVGGWGLHEKFFQPPSRRVLDVTYLNTRTNGHAMRVVGYDEEQSAFLLQNSWGPLWCEAIFDDKIEEGCCMVSEAALSAAWDLDVLEIRK